MTSVNNEVEKGTALLDACQALELNSIESISGDYTYQDEETGFGPLHKVILGCSRDHQDKAIEILKHLLSNGAVWNQCMQII